jgi:hypothetical protein
MNNEIGVLHDLRAWLDAHRSELAENGYQIDYSESPQDRMKRSASLMIASSRRVGQLILWETGEAELSLGDISSSEVSEQHREITSRIGLIDAAETIIEWLDENGPKHNGTTPGTSP